MSWGNRGIGGGCAVRFGWVPMAEFSTNGGSDVVGKMLIISLNMRTSFRSGLMVRDGLSIKRVPKDIMCWWRRISIKNSFAQ